LPLALCPLPLALCPLPLAPCPLPFAPKFGGLKIKRKEGENIIQQ